MRGKRPTHWKHWKAGTLAVLAGCVLAVLLTTPAPTVADDLGPGPDIRIQPEPEPAPEPASPPPPPPPPVSSPAPEPAHAAVAGDGYVGEAVCLTCHEDLKDDYSHTIHYRTLSAANARTDLQARGCEACHGPGQAHVDAGGGAAGNLVTFRAESPEKIEQENGVCLTCHAGGERLYWDGSPHEGSDLACTSCHVVMKSLSPRNQLSAKREMDACAECHLLPRAQAYRNAHMPVREGKISCGSCHNPHGTVADKLNRHMTVNENCLSCHAEKRGPFLWVHPPVTEDCTNCHVPHGSTRRAMLRAGVPRLCQQCHNYDRHPSRPQDPADRFVVGRACLNCHPQIHGSNHPSGNRFTR